MVVVGLYIYIDGVAKRVELFNDEKISVTSSAQDVQDISKVFTDYSQSFTVPASKTNNAIFGHWYENSVSGGFDARVRKDAYIELDTIPFRKGKIQLEKANLKNGQIDNYSITFYGSLISLKDAFRDRQLKDLDFSSYNYAYSGTDVVTRISDNITADIKFPLISSGNVWQYGTNGRTPTNWDIKKNSSPMYTNELFPAMRISKIFDVIAASVGATFTGNFLNDDRFKRAFLWLKNNDGLFNLIKAPTPINFGNKTATPTSIASKFDLTKDEFYYDGGIVVTPNGNQTVSNVSSYIELTFTVPNIPYNFLIYKDGLKVSELSLTSSLFAFAIELPLDSAGNYKFYVSSNTTLFYDALFYYNTTGLDPITGLTVSNTITANTTSIQNTSTFIDIGAYMPDIKVEDFFSGILKMFNLTCYSLGNGTFKIQQLEDWYSEGVICDISKYVITDTTDVERMTSYKNVNFKYDKPENVLSILYKQNSTHEYGDLLYQLNVDGGDYTVQLPFENIMFNKFTGTELQVGYSLKSDYKPYKPKPVILYDYGTILPCNFHINDGSSTNNVFFYNAFGQDTNISGVNYTLNWGIEQSSLTGQAETKTLFNQYYSTYISNIFNSRARKIKIKALLPTSLLTLLKLNDRIIIRDKKYLINSFTTDLTTGVVDFDLITDFR